MKLSKWVRIANFLFLKTFWIEFYVWFVFQANSEAACERACSFENEFLCRSYLYLGPPTGSDYNCKLYHLDHWTLPDGISAFLNSQTPLIGDGSRIGKYYENRCESKYFSMHAALSFTKHERNTFYFLLQICVLLNNGLKQTITGLIFTWMNLTFFCKCYSKTN